MVALRVLDGILSGLAHEFNNRLGSIVLNADYLATSCPEARDVSNDIAQSAEAIVEVARGLDVLLGGSAPNPPLRQIQKLAERFTRGYLRQRGVDVRVAHVDEEILVASNPASVFLAMLLSLVVFARKMDGSPSSIAISFSERGSARCWRMDVDRPVDRDENALMALQELCASEEWILSSGDRWLSIDAKVEA